jgi:hypothetical protein
MAARLAGIVMADTDNGAVASQGCGRDCEFPIPDDVIKMGLPIALFEA